MTAKLRELREPARVLLMLDRPVIAAVLALALTHGRYVTRVARAEAAAVAALRRLGPAPRRCGHGPGPGYDPGAARGRPAARRATARHRPDAARRSRDHAGGLRLGGRHQLLVEPFAPEELVARVLALMKRTFGAAVALEQSLLYLLAANAGRLLTRGEILEYLWGADHAAGSNVVDRHVRNLRLKPADDWQRPRYIATVPGRGYRFLPTAPDDAPPTTASPSAR